MPAPRKLTLATELLEHNDTVHRFRTQKVTKKLALVNYILRSPATLNYTEKFAFAIPDQAPRAFDLALDAPLVGGGTQPEASTRAWNLVARSAQSSVTSPCSATCSFVRSVELRVSKTFG